LQHLGCEAEYSGETCPRGFAVEYEAAFLTNAKATAMARFCLLKSFFLLYAYGKFCVPRLIFFRSTAILESFSVGADFISTIKTNKFSAQQVDAVLNRKFHSKLRGIKPVRND